MAETAVQPFLPEKQGIKPIDSLAWEMKNAQILKMYELVFLLFSS